MKVRYFGKTEIGVLLLSAFILFLSYSFTCNFFEDDIKTYDSGWMSVRGNSYLNITYLDPKPIQTDVDGTNLYLAGYRLSDQLVNYFILQADPNSKETKELIKNADHLEEHPQRVLGSRNGSKPHPLIQKVVQETSQSKDLDKEVSLYFEKEDYFSISELDNQVQSMLVAGLVLLLIYGVFAAVPNGYLILQWRRARQAKRELFKLYPELMGAFDHLEMTASYLDKRAGVAIYKDHLILFGQRFGMIDLREAQTLVVSKSNDGYFVNPFIALFVKLFHSTTVMALGARGNNSKAIPVNQSLNQPDVKNHFIEGVQSYSPSIEVYFKK